MIKLPHTTRIAVTGIAGGGKTVFLTTLLSHLSEFNGENLPGLGPSFAITRFREMHAKRWPLFRLDTYRQSLSKCEWPRKSTAYAQFVCEYDRSDWRFRSQRMELFDFPGERIADAAIAAFKRYDDWSDHILDHFTNKHDYDDAARPYLAYIDSGVLVEEDVLQMYRFSLASLILQYKPLITPSTFLLDQEGTLAQGTTPDEISHARLTGLSPAKQFAPLSQRAREENPLLLNEMKARYADYRRTIALPVFEELDRAQRLVVLVDIPSLLAGGVGRYNDNRQILLDLFEFLQPDSNLGLMFRKLLGLITGSLDRVAFVASKADTIHPDDIRDGRLEQLLREMTYRARNMLPGVEFQWFACSACNSTYPAENGRKLIGRLAYDNPDKQLREYDVPELPESWPDDWDTGDYPFFRVYPDAPKNLLKPPRHFNLDQVFKFIAG